MIKELPSLGYLEECFVLREGNLFWKNRPSKHFKRESVRKATNKRFAGKMAGYASASGYVSVRLDNSLYQAHRIIYKMYYKEEPKVIDHLDRDKSNNLPNNLQSGSQKDNCENSSRSTYEGSEYPSGKFRVRIRHCGRLYHIGMFDKKAEARRVHADIRFLLKGKTLTDSQVRGIIQNFKQQEIKICT